MVSMINKKKLSSNTPSYLELWCNMAENCIQYNSITCSSEKLRIKNSAKYYVARAFSFHMKNLVQVYLDTVFILLQSAKWKQQTQFSCRLTNTYNGILEKSTIFSKETVK